MITHADTTALVTGASSGIGSEFARQLAARGANLVLVARREDRLQALAQDLQSEYDIDVTVVPLDLALPDAAGQLAADLAARDLGIDTLVNNAGFGVQGAFAEASPERTQDMIAVNGSAVVELTRALLPAMVSRQSGIVVNVASAVAFMPSP